MYPKLPSFYLNFESYMLKVRSKLHSSAIHATSNKCLSTYSLNQTQDYWLLRGRKRLHKEILSYLYLSSHSSVSIETFTRWTHVVLWKWMRRHVLFITMSPSVQPVLRMSIGEHNSLFWQGKLFRRMWLLFRNHMVLLISVFLSQD